MNDGVSAFSQADEKRAKWLFSKALELYQGIDNQQGVLFCHINLAEVAFSIKDFQTAQLHLDRAAAMVKNTALQKHQSRITLLYAQSALQQKDYNQAEKVLQTLLPEFNGESPIAIPDTIQLTAIANRTKIAFIQQRDESVWTQRYATALTLTDNQSPILKSRLLRFQADLLHRQQHYQEAESHLQLALTGYKTQIYRPGIAATLAELGLLSMSQKHWQDAQNYLIRSSQVFRFIGKLDKVIQNTRHLVTIEHALGNIERSDKLKEWLAEIQSEQPEDFLKKPLAPGHKQEYK